MQVERLSSEGRSFLMWPVTRRGRAQRNTSASYLIGINALHKGAMRGGEEPCNRGRRTRHPDSAEATYESKTDSQEAPRLPPEAVGGAPHTCDMSRLPIGYSLTWSSTFG